MTLGNAVTTLPAIDWKTRPTRHGYEGKNKRIVSEFLATGDKIRECKVDRAHVATKLAGLQYATKHMDVPVRAVRRNCIIFLCRTDMGEIT